jgi:hypothetical protein
VSKYDDVTAATLRAGEALSLETEKKQMVKDRAVLRFYHASKDRVDVPIERRSATVTSITFDVGRSGAIA